MVEKQMLLAKKADLNIFSSKTHLELAARNAHTIIQLDTTQQIEWRNETNRFSQNIIRTVKL